MNLHTIELTKFELLLLEYVLRTILQGDSCLTLLTREVAVERLKTVLTQIHGEMGYKGIAALREGDI